MRRAVSLTLMFAVLGLSLPIRAADPPEPSPFPTSWEFTFEHKEPRRIVVNVPGSRSPKAYWYMPYTVTNEGEESQEFVPQFEILTEDGKLFRAARNVPK